MLRLESTQFIQILPISGNIIVNISTRAIFNNTLKTNF
ncbi:hypothetical protein TSAR_008025 [Trichomalopsis sarcophagae]|uniref:Uncharacterized protein n=1 Tax=Trichomalopsis sarcophagae TaxID=543379 RepID=A0A232FNC1_9HYME|nr:hypothetical protein TSAR_008025 [Trichomalopsis sarcophagae]